MTLWSALLNTYSIMGVIDKPGFVAGKTEQRVMENNKLLLALRREGKGRKIRGEMGTECDSRDGQNGHRPTASRCDLPL